MFPSSLHKIYFEQLFFLYFFFVVVHYSHVFLKSLQVYYFESTMQPSNQPIMQSINQSIQPIMQSTNQSTNLSVNSTNPSINQEEVKRETRMGLRRCRCFSTSCGAVSKIVLHVRVYV